MPSIEPVTLGRFRGFVTHGKDKLPPVLAIHGAFGHPAQLAPLMTALAQHGVTTYALPLAGHVQGTEDAVRGLGVRDYVRDVAEMITIMPSTPILLGHSMGGLICEKVAEVHAVRGLVLAGAAPGAALMATMRALPTWFRLMPRIMRGVPIAPPRAAVAALAFVNSSAAERQAVTDALVPESGRAMRDMILGKVKIDRSRVRCPIVSVFGDRDYLVPPRQLRAEARRLGATVFEYRGAGHFLMETSWTDRIADDVASWMRRVMTPTETAVAVAAPT